MPLSLMNLSPAIANAVPGNPWEKLQYGLVWLGAEDALEAKVGEEVDVTIVDGKGHNTG